MQSASDLQPDLRLLLRPGIRLCQRPLGMRLRTIRVIVDDREVEESSGHQVLRVCNLVQGHQGHCTDHQA